MLPTFSSARIFFAVTMFAAFYAIRADAQQSHTVKLKDGTVYLCERVETTAYRITLFGAQRQQQMGSRPLTLQGPRDAGSTVDNRRGDQGQTLYFDWKELADESIEKYFPRRWIELQRQRAPAAAAPAARPPAPQPAQPLQLRMPQPTHPVNPPPSIPPPLPPTIAAPAPAPAVVKDRLGNIALRAQSLARHNEDVIAQLEVANVSSRKLYDARAVLFTSDNELAEGASVASLLAPDHNFSATFRIHLARAANRDDLMLSIKCYESPAEVEGRKAVFYNFRIQRQASGEFTLSAAE
jgi:hypothetical protein